MTSCTTYTHTNGSNSNKQSNTVSARLTPLEHYSRLATALEALALLANWHSASPTNTATFREIVRAICARLRIDDMLRSLMPAEEQGKPPIAERSQTNPRCF